MVAILFQTEPKGLVDNELTNNFTVPTLAPSDAPSNLTAMAINSTSAHFSWLPPDEAQHNGNIRHYNIRILELHSGEEFQINSTNTYLLYTGLHPAYTYSFTVAAVTVETGPYSDPAITTTPEDGMHMYLCSLILFYQTEPYL